MLEPNEVLKTLTGRGLVTAAECEPVRVRYHVVVERREADVIAYGTLQGHHAGLRPIWLEPDAQLRLANGRRLNISLTDLLADTAEFESTGPIGTLLATAIPTSVSADLRTGAPAVARREHLAILSQEPPRRAAR